MENKYSLASLGIYQNQTELRIDNIKIHKKEMELFSPFETSFGRFDRLIRFFPEITFSTNSGKKITGIGECSPLNLPQYDYQCSRSVETILEYITTSLKTDKNIITDVNSFINIYKWITGHSVAKAGIEGAYWDAIAQLKEVPVYKLFGGTRKTVMAGTSIGLEETVDAVMKKAEIAIEEIKVARIKLKVKPGKDIKYIEAIRKKYPEFPFQVDANASYDLFHNNHLAILKEFDNYNLLMIEQPGNNEDFIDHSKQLASLNTPICLDESILNINHARQAIELWIQYSDTSRLIINIKPPRVGGYFEAIKIAKLCSENGVKVWCGGMYESALGKTANVHFSSREEVVLPGDHISQAPYFKKDIADAPKYMNGEIFVPTDIGWGVKNIDLKHI